MPKDKTPIIAAALRRYTTDPALASTYDEHYRDTELLQFDTAFLKSEFRTPGTLLDIGCGTGRHLIALARSGHRCVGMDLSMPMLEIARAKVAVAAECDVSTEAGAMGAPVGRGATDRISLIQANMRSPLPFQPESFDYVICMFSTMGLIPSSAERLAFLGEVKRVLKPGGTFVLHVHNRLYNVVAGWGRWWLLKTYTWNRIFTNLEVGDKIIENYRGIEDMYLHVFSLGEVRRLLRDAGFDVRRALCLNDDRTGEVTGAWAAIRANGFVVAATLREGP